MTASVSVVVPVFNERENLPELLRRTLAAGRALGRPWELLLVDDGSRDGSSDMLTEYANANPGEVKALLLYRNAGQHNAILCGFAHAQGDILVTLDADLQNPPEEIGRLVAKIEEGFDVVGSVRQDRQDAAFRKIFSGMVNLMVRRSTGVILHDYGCMLRAYRRKVVEAMLTCRERSTFIPVLANLFARRVTEIPVGHAERAAGTSKYSFLKLINLQFDLLTSMTSGPCACCRGWASASPRRRCCSAPCCWCCASPTARSGPARGCSRCSPCCFSSWGRSSSPSA